ncbi:hypothetical protein DUD43_03445 [Alcaligenes faecalis]|uniref:hypothetical protein n=1 Tax=Alcaligenes faecalis TaxID=511 RepID=UPI0012933686|nr:hypothetical protein [Alcaligenes faecalis]QFY76810.1 hypothetical protein DUD43_03445 [Alcaligenes faecalis]
MQALSQLSYTPISVFFFVDHQRRIEIMKVFLSLCKSFEEKNQNKVKKTSEGLSEREVGQAGQAMPQAGESRKSGFG